MTNLATLREIEPGVYRLTVPWVKPPTKNPWERMHWAARRRMKTLGYEWVLIAKIHSRIETIETPVVIQPVVLLKRTHNPPDAGSYQAPINEVLIDHFSEERTTVKGGRVRHKKGVGLFKDDGPEYVTELSTIVELGAPIEEVQLIITTPKGQST